MTLRNPLVNIAGVLTELPVGDTVPANVNLLQPSGQWFPAISLTSVFQLPTSIFILIPVYIGGPVNAIGCVVSYYGGSGNARLGIYNSSNYLPSTLLIDAGTVNCSTSGLKLISFNPTIVPGLYFIAIGMDNMDPYLFGLDSITNINLSNPALSSPVQGFYAFYAQAFTFPSSVNSPIAVKIVGNYPAAFLRYA